MRAPPESFSPTIGAPSFIARSMIFTIFAALVSEIDPPKTVKSCAKAKTCRPSTSPWPVTTPSPGTIVLLHAEVAAAVRDELVELLEGAGSKSSSIRSRAVSLPAACCRFWRSSPPPSSARRSRSARVCSGSMAAGWWLVARCWRQVWQLAPSAQHCIAASRFYRLRLLPVLEELLEADVGERMVEHLIDDRRRAGRDVGAHARRFDRRESDGGSWRRGFRCVKS